MRIVGNALNGYFFDNLAYAADNDSLEHVIAAVAYVKDMGPILDVAKNRGVPITLFALADEGGFPALNILRKFVLNSPPSWQLFLIRRCYHPKIVWFRGVGCYIGSANLTDSGRNRNLECGVWFDEDDLDSLNWRDELASMLDVIRENSTPATEEDIGRFERISEKRRKLEKLQKELADTADRELAHLPGQESLIQHNLPKRAGGAARATFVKQWAKCLTILRKQAAVIKKVEWPEWVDADVEPAIAFDQATEYFFEFQVRRSGAAKDTTDTLHEQNRKSPETAVLRLMKEWASFDGQGTWDWPAWANENPRRLHQLLQPSELADLTEDKLADIIYLTHAAREHARQIRNRTVGLPDGAERTREERCRLLAALLLGKTAEKGGTVSETLQYALWADEQEQDAAARIWNAVHSPRWKFPHLGVNILGEMIGYARPDKYPPRNDRVVRSLKALGFEGLGI